MGRSLLQSAQEKYEIEPPERTDLVLDMIYAPIFYRLLKAICLSTPCSLTVSPITP